MKTIIELRQERKDLVDSAESLLASAEDANRELTSDEQEAFDAAMNRADAIGKDIANRENAGSWPQEDRSRIASQGSE